jgi:polar amino acid transport system substrate-binding protein
MPHNERGPAVRHLKNVKRLLMIVGACGVAAPAAFGGFAAAVEQTRNPHQEALLALSDIDAAVSELNSASSLTEHSASPYRKAAQRAANAVVGMDAPDFQASAGNPGDSTGALGHLTWLSDHSGGGVWGPPVQGSLANAKVAQAHLAEAAKADGLDDYWLQSSDALQALLVAAGRGSQLGVLGGLHGALTTTDLGVPADGKVVSGCAAPAQTPAYGVVKGYLTYLAIPRDEGSTRLPEMIGVRDVSVRGNAIVMHTAAAGLVGQLCPTVETVAAVSNADDAPHAGGVAALYTEQQAKAGKQVFDSSCASCHGTNLQGVSAPPVGGSVFLNKTKLLDWSVADMRNVVVNSMPANNPGSLSPEQYADVLAYLLAVNCYPAGNNSFPTSASPALKQAPLHPIQGAKGEDSKNKTCPVKG